MQYSLSQLPNQSKALMEAILSKVNGVSKPQKKFLVFMLCALLSLRCRKTVLNLSRFGGLNEKTIRLQLQKDFDWPCFNTELILRSTSNERIIALDPSYLPKSGKSTWGKDKFWSGVAGMAKPGIEFTGIAVVDLCRRTALGYRAIQTPTYKELARQGTDLLGHYCRMINIHGQALRELSPYLVVDGYFSKERFVGTALLQGFDVISKFRPDVRLRYILPEKDPAMPRKRGRPSKYDGVVDTKKPETKYLERICSDKAVLYSGILNVVAWKVDLKVVIVKSLDEKKVIAVLFSTDLNLSASTILNYYSARFQIEFLYRDAKQFTGMTHCQCRSQQALDFHVNASITAVSVAKVAHYFDPATPKPMVYSIDDIQNSYFNELMINRFISMFAINPNLQLNRERIDKLRQIGAKVA